MKLKITCPCCNKSVQVILSDVDTGDVKVTGVFLNEENDGLDTNNQEELEKILAEKYNILFG
jgi:hypothetical protein